MNNVKNVVIEVVSDEDGEVSVRSCGLGEWEWLGMVWGGDENNRMGSVEDVMLGGESMDVYGDKLFEMYWKKLEEEFEKYKEEEVERGWFNDDVDWDVIKKELFDKCKEVFGDGMSLSFVKVGGYSVEVDNEFVVIIGKM